MKKMLIVLCLVFTLSVASGCRSYQNVMVKGLSVSIPTSWEQIDNDRYYSKDDNVYFQIIDIDEKNTPEDYATFLCYLDKGVCGVDLYWYETNKIKHYRVSNETDDGIKKDYCYLNDKYGYTVCFLFSYERSNTKVPKIIERIMGSIVFY